MYQLTECFNTITGSSLLESFGPTRPNFISDLLDVMQEAEARFLTEQQLIANETGKVINLTTFTIVNVVLEAIEAAFGELTLPELLVVTSAVSHRQGHSQASSEQANSMLAQLQRHLMGGEEQALYGALNAQFHNQNGQA